MNVSNIIIIIILLAIILSAIKETISHFKGEGNCCGGTAKKPPKKRMKGVPKEVLTLQIEGMHCRNCKNRVEAALNGLDGVVAKVSFAKGEAKILVYEGADKEGIPAEIEKAGYGVKIN